LYNTYEFTYQNYNEHDTFNFNLQKYCKDDKNYTTNIPNAAGLRDILNGVLNIPSNIARGVNGSINMLGNIPNGIGNLSTGFTNFSRVLDNLADSIKTQNFQNALAKISNIDFEGFKNSLAMIGISFSSIAAVLQGITQIINILQYLVEYLELFLGQFILSFISSLRILSLQRLLKQSYNIAQTLNVIKPVNINKNSQKFINLIYKICNYIHNKGSTDMKTHTFLE